MKAHDGAVAVLMAVLGVTLWRTLLVFDALRGPSGLVARSARRISASITSRQASPKHQRRLGASSGNPIRFTWAIRRLFAAFLAMPRLAVGNSNMAFRRVGKVGRLRTRCGQWQPKSWLSSLSKGGTWQRLLLHSGSVFR